MKMVCTRAGDSRIEYAPDSKLLRLLLSRVVFVITSEGEGCRFIQEVHVRVGPLGARLNRREFEAVRQHMEEEGGNLKAMMERSAQ
jgi:hypothetical protein